MRSCCAGPGVLQILPLVLRFFECGCLHDNGTLERVCTYVAIDCICVYVRVPWTGLS